MKDADNLTARQRRYCEEYIVDHNQQQACLRAGYAYSKGWASRVHNKPEVQIKIAELSKKLSEKVGLSAERIIEEMRRIGLSNVADYYKRKGKNWVLKDLDELTLEQQAAISEYSPGKFIKLYDKGGALDKLGKHFKLYTDIDGAAANLFVLPELTLRGEPVVFNVGKPAPKVNAKKP